MEYIQKDAMLYRKSLNRKIWDVIGFLIFQPCNKKSKNLLGRRVRIRKWSKL